MRAEILRLGEKVILQEDCAEDRLKNGILTLTTQRLLFEKTEGKVATFWKEEGELLLDIDLNKISKVESQGFVIAKVAIYVAEHVYKFGVFNPGRWAKLIKKQIENINHPDTS
ncbi:MAG: hypothetical protein WBM37_04620 [Nitrososphaeraceae archaeon]